jgi:hypothetical protein
MGGMIGLLEVEVSGRQLIKRWQNNDGLGTAETGRVELAALGFEGVYSVEKNVQRCSAVQTEEADKIGRL